MPILVLSLAETVGVLLGLAALAYLALALHSTWRTRQRPEAVPGWHPSVSVLKPVHGTAPYLYDCLRSFCEQDWHEYEVIFGAHSDGDPAIDVVQRLIAEFPQRSLRLVVDASLAGPNRKAANLANIYRHARHDIIILADSDVRVDRTCIAAMAAPFADGKVGTVACVYKGLPVQGSIASFGALHINDWMVPSVLVDVDLRGIDFVLGAMSAVRRQALDQIGGFQHLSQSLAEDFAMGRLVARNGWQVMFSPYACEVVVPERDLAGMLRREVRWQRSERACRPLDHFLSVVTYPLPLLLVLLLPEPSIVGLTIIGGQLAARIALHYLVRRSLCIATPAQPWLVPLRECVCFLAWAASLAGNKVSWASSTFSIAAFRRQLSVGSAVPAASRPTHPGVERA
ncbi:MAG TPA: bacteriohopanetetrol glucosamine biosynthesis glycosyltransferase HpnI [Hyphomicrobiaceae bacterium]|nr:bacteriohopanetetrol glucosamine biosynthesis glycosyltransferase HpnI [Hyphomicrobiaceae bacterium]